MWLLRVYNLILEIGRGMTVYIYIKISCLKVFSGLRKKTQKPIVEGVLWMSCLSKWQWRIVYLRGGRRTMVHGGVSECNTLYQTRIYWFARSTASLGHKSHFTVSPTTRAICYHGLSLIVLKNINGLCTIL